MLNIEKLRKILCEVPEIKEDLMELRFGAKILQHSHVKKETFYLGEIEDEDSCMGSMIFSTYSIWGEFPYGSRANEYSDDFRGNNKNNSFEIIGNDLEERHLRMYCRMKGLNPITNGYGEIQTPMREPVVELDELKSFHNQSEETLQKIIDFTK